MKPQEWKDLLNTRGVDPRIIDLVAGVAEKRALEPPTTDTQQLLIACEVDGYAAGRIGTSVLSLFFDPDRARQISIKHEFDVGQRSEATWIVRVPAGDLDIESRRTLIIQLVYDALDRVLPLGAWNRGFPDQKKAYGDLCPVHFVKRSLTGECPDCE